MADDLDSGGGEMQGLGARRPVDRVGAVRREEGFFERGAGTRLYHCEWWPEPGGGAAPILVVMHGYAEHCRRYDEFAEYLLQRDIAVCRFDARGHGRSNGQRGYVERFEEYIEDLCVYVQRVAALAPGRPLALLGHSNGGLIAIRALQAGLAGVNALVLTNPMIELRAAQRPVPDALARWLSRICGRLPLPNGLRPEQLTHDPALQAARRSDRWASGLATPRWYWSALCAGRAALEEAEKLTLPLLVVVGEADPIVEFRAVQAFHERAASLDKELRVRPGELHEVLNESERRVCFAQIADWLERRAVVSARARPPEPRP